MKAQRNNTLQRHCLMINVRFWSNFFPPLQLRPFPENPALQEQRYDPRVFLQSAFTSQTLTEALHSSESVNENPNRVERQYTLIMKDNFKRIIVQIHFYQVSHSWLKKTQGCDFQTALSSRLCKSFYVDNSNNILNRSLVLEIKANSAFTLLSRMRTSQDLLNPTLKNLDSYEYEILVVIYCRTWLRYKKNY